MPSHALTSSLAENSVGAGLKPAHYAKILAERPEIGFFEIHAENYMNAGGPNLRWLSALAELYPLSVHGVGLSLGSMEKLDSDHLARLQQAVARTAPALVSEHLAWSDFSGRAFPDLLPLPYDEASLVRVAEKIDAVQRALGRPILIENPATYLRFEGDAFAEPQFLAELCARTGCSLLLDVNNVHVSAVNHGFVAENYLEDFPMELVGEIHLAGHAEARDARGAFLIDDHGGPVSDEVWALYRAVVARAPRPTLIEWDNNVPDWPILLEETQKARAAMPFSPCGRRWREAPDEGFVPRAQRSLIRLGYAEPPSPARGEGSAARPSGESWQSAFASALQDQNSPAPPLFAPCDAQARFAVYRNNSALAEIGALKEQFPTVLQLIDEEAFHGLARAFAQKNPPRSPVLGEYGEDFPDFIEAFLTAIGATETPYLPDIARLDWVCLKVLRAKEANSCGAARLAALDPARIGEARAKPHPALAMVASDWPLLALRDPEAREIGDWRGEIVLALRPEAEVRLTAISPGAAAFLSACRQNASLAEAARAGEKAEAGFDFGQTLVALTQAGAFSDFEFDEGRAK